VFERLKRWLRGTGPRVNGRIYSKKLWKSTIRQREKEHMEECMQRQADEEHARIAEQARLRQEKLMADAQHTAVRKAINDTNEAGRETAKSMFFRRFPSLPKVLLRYTSEKDIPLAVVGINSVDVTENEVVPEPDGAAFPPTTYYEIIIWVAAPRGEARYIIQASQNPMYLDHCEDFPFSRELPQAGDVVLIDSRGNMRFMPMVQLGHPEVVLLPTEEFIEDKFLRKER
jgi:hypothetical protein